jgi:hypothetical protein
MHTNIITTHPLYHQYGSKFTQDIEAQDITVTLHHPYLPSSHVSHSITGHINNSN